MKEQYKHIASLAERTLLLLHGNAGTERLFSSLKRILTADRNSLQDLSLNGFLAVKSFLQNRGYDSASLPINSVLLRRGYDACDCYDQFLKRKAAARIEKDSRKEAMRKEEEDATAKKKREEA
jgi:hypothetical protein